MKFSLIFSHQGNIHFLVIFCILLLSMARFESKSQGLRAFSGDTEAFPGELTIFMGSNLDDSQIEVIALFEANWNSGNFNTKEKERIINIADLLVNQNARPVPHFLNLIRLLNLFSEKDPVKRHFPVWLEAFSYYADNNRYRLSLLNESLERVYHFLNDDAIYKSSAVEWQAVNGNVRFIFEASLTIIIDNADLICYSGNDSIVINNTSGKFSIDEMQWKGRNGSVGWERAGYELHEINAVLDNYTIDLNNNQYSADSVIFTYGEYFREKLRGSLTDRVTRVTESSETSYPRFNSYRHDLSLDNIFPGINYKGGISMRGKNLIGSGSEDSKAHITIMRNGETFFTALSEHFLFSREEFSANSSTVTFHLKGDSIYHPDLRLNYRNNPGELTLNRNDNVMSGSPYTNTYHEVNMNFGQLIWQMNEDVIHFTMPRGSSTGSANFESFSFFNNARFREIQGRDEVHPLLSVRRFASANEERELTAKEYASFMRRPVSSIRHQLISLAIEGFIYYDTGSDIFTVRKKLNDYLMASHKLIDFDVINFESKTDAPRENGVLDLNTLELKINGIPQVHISNVQNVNIYPEDNSVILKENRNFQFGGRVNAGYLTFFGNNFSFDYDKFSINLRKIDSISIRAARDEYDMYGRALAENVKNLIQNVTGIIYVDEPTNKSGNNEYEDFPKFHSTENSFVFYDDPETYGGVYDKADVYFQLYPFRMDSLNTFRFEYVELEGKFVSSGIFPEFEETLTLQDDLSIGFTHIAEEEGLPVYDGKGRFYDMITMSNSGLKGDGVIEYLASKIYSEDIGFFPDSMNAAANEFLIERSGGSSDYPMVSSKNNLVQWLPYQDELYVRQVENPFTILDNETHLKGELLLSSSELTGEGILETRNSAFESSLFRFGPDSFESDTTDFILYNKQGEKAVFESTGILAKVETDRLRGEFRVNNDEPVIFPVNRYKAFPEEILWDIDAMELQLLSKSAAENETDEGTLFISVCDAQDSLYYISPATVFRYGEKLISSEGVRRINVADALIFPGDGKVEAEKTGFLNELSDARLEIGPSTAQHTINNAKIRIDGKKSYNGTGYYDYVDDRNKIQKIRLDTILVNDDIKTVARGTIDEGDKFRLSEHFLFKGEALLESGKQYLNFNGSVRLITDCFDGKDNWLYFSHDINPLNVMIPVPQQPVSDDEGRIDAGLFISGAPEGVYPLFLGKTKNSTDTPIITAGGFLQYHQTTNAYLIGTVDRFNDPEYPGNFLSLDTEKCMLYGEGEIEPGVNLGQLKLNAAGHFTSSTRKQETNLELAMGVDFFFSDDAIEIMANEFAEESETGEIDSTAFFYRKGLSQILGKESAEEYLGGARSGASGRRVPEAMDKTLFFNKVNFVWDEENNSYRSSGKLNLKYIGGVKINREINGYIEISKRETGDFFDLYIEAAEGKWYYFGYTRGVMQTYSSNTQFRETINDLRTRRRELNVSRGETSYIYMLATETKLNQFFSRYGRYREAAGVSEIEVVNEEK